MPRWQQLQVPWNKLRRKKKDKKSQNYHNNNTQNVGPKKNSIQIITDDPAEEDALYFGSYSKNLANIIREAKPKFAIGIFGKWGTGKTTLMKMIKGELEKGKGKDKILTVWFDAWRYEKEKHLAVIPFLRQIRIALENKLKDQEDGESSRWTILRDALQKTFTAFMISTEFSVSPEGSPVSTSINFEKFYDSLKSKGSVFIDGERRQFHEHSTDYLQAALTVLKKELGDARIVVFVDDLDRCTPLNALEVIESIKAFFDIEGIVYVIGMDSDSIDHIIKEKYGEIPEIKGIDYLQKIVQLPFQIPVWKPQDIHESISTIISKGLGESKLADEFLKDKRKELIVKAIEPNPRQVKRFVNNIILARAVFGKEIDIDKLIAVQALNFRLKWNKFLELISEHDTTRKTFLRSIISLSKRKIKVFGMKMHSINLLKNNPMQIKLWLLRYEAFFKNLLKIRKMAV